MPLSSTKFAPGFDKQSTVYGAEGKWVDGENVRFRYGQPEKIGGWIDLFTDKLIGVVRDQFAWTDLTGTRHLALGTDRKLYVYKEGVVADVTPIRATESNLTNPFVTTSGSAIVTVTDSGHGATAGDFVTFSNADAVGGLDMNAEFEITSIISSSQYTVTHSSNASSGATGGGSSTVDVEYQIAPGPETNVYGYGWGIPAWNGVITPTITDQLNEALDATETDVDVDDGSKFAANDYILVDQEIMKVSSVSSNTLTVIRGVASVTSSTSNSAVGSHARTTHADNTAVTLVVDASNTAYIFTGWNTASTTSTTTIDSRYWVFESFGEDLLALAADGSLFKWDTSAGTTSRAALASANAPTASRHLILSTPDRHLILMGTETTIGSTTSQDDLFLRFSNQEDFTTWFPSSVNTAGSFRIQDGSKIMTTVRSRGSILIWTDTSLHSLQFIGPPFIFGLNQVGANCGAVSPHCAVDVNGTSFWMSQNAFYMFDGAIKKLPCTVQDFVFDNFSIAQQGLVYAGLNTDFNEITWFYASKDSDFIDRNVTYNYLENLWYTNTLARTTWLDRGVYDLPYATEYLPTTNGTTPTVLGLTDGASRVYVHESGFDNVIDPIVCSLQSGDFDIQDGEQLLSISRFIPDFKEQRGSAEVLLSFKDYNSITNETTLNGALGSGALTSITLTDASNFPSSGTILIDSELISYTSKTVNVLGGTITRGVSGTTAAAHVDDKKVINYTNVRINLSTVTPTTTKVDTRGRGRQGNLLISSRAVGDNWRFGTLRLDVKPDGGR
jgi:hypothetical protein|tara:strand:+ start:40 stop:2391 length:2352 start_codon:yes stop_codon:yes gene_type:complete